MAPPLCSGGCGQWARRDGTCCSEGCIKFRPSARGVNLPMARVVRAQRHTVPLRRLVGKTPPARADLVLRSARRARTEAAFTEAAAAAVPATPAAAAAPAPATPAAATAAAPASPSTSEETLKALLHSARERASSPLLMIPIP